MTSARYSWGWQGAKIVALLNCIACVGWSAVNTIAGAQTLRVVANDNISHAVGVVVIAVITLFLGLFGYKWVHIYERYSWIPTAITFFGKFVSIRARVSFRFADLRSFLFLYFPSSSPRMRC